MACVSGIFPFKNAKRSKPIEFSEDLLSPSDRLELSVDPNAAWRVLEECQRFDPVPRTIAGAGGPGPGKVRCVCISDTHGLHRGVAVPRGDILIHCGDITNTGEPDQVLDFALWLQEMKVMHGFQHVVVIAGNHDTTFHEEYYRDVGGPRFHARGQGIVDPVHTKRLLTTATHEDRSGATVNDERNDSGNGIIYLEDDLVELPVGVPVGNGATSTGAVSVYGSPWQPEFCEWAFNLERGPACQATWAKIPEAAPHSTVTTTTTATERDKSLGATSSPRRAVDLLLTHGPPLGRGDLLHPSGSRSGCVDLLRRVQMRVQPLLHAFGHIHEGAGEVSFDGSTLFANASTCTFHYQSLNPAVVVDLSFDLPANFPIESVDSSAGSMASSDSGDVVSAPPLQVPAADSRPVRAEVMSSRIAEWSPMEVNAWLDNEERAAASTESCDTAAADDSDNKSKGSSISPNTKEDSSNTSSSSLDRALLVNRETTWHLPLGIAARLRGLDGPKLLALRPGDAELNELQRNVKADCLRAIRHLEASEMN